MAEHKITDICRTPRVRMIPSVRTITSVRAIFILTALVFFCMPIAFAGRLETVPTGLTQDFLGVAYHPSGSSALVVGEGIYEFDGAQLTQVSGIGVFHGAAWRPQGDYALIVGTNGQIFMYNGVQLRCLTSGYYPDLNAVAFSPGGDQAVIVGWWGSVALFENNTLTDISLYSDRVLEGVCWHPDGSHALITGINDFTTEEVIKWDRTELTVVYAGPAGWPGDIDYHPTDDYALICKTWGHAATFGNGTYENLVTGFELDTDGLTGVAWSPDGTTALITGAWYHGTHGDLRTVIEYDGERFNALRMFENFDAYEDVAWKPDSSQALIVGKNGGLQRYHTDVRIMGSVYCDKINYKSGETMSAYLDLLNRGPQQPVDLYILIRMLDSPQDVFYWPGFGVTPTAVPLKLPPGLTLEGYCFFSQLIPSLPPSILFDWELWVFDQGSSDIDDVYTFHPYLVRINV